MNYQNAVLPRGAKYVVKSPEMTATTVLPGILKKHMAPKGKCGLLVVTHGSLQFVWEDTGEVFDADSAHPVVIDPERYHHVRITGPVQFHVEFYNLPCPETVADPDAHRPGESFTAPGI